MDKQTLLMRSGFIHNVIAIPYAADRVADTAIKIINKQEKRIIELEGFINQHNKEMNELCNGKKSCGYEKYARRCGNCWLDNVIDLPTPPIDTGSEE
jgi:hypothetical protein